MADSRITGLHHTGLITTLFISYQMVQPLSRAKKGWKAAWQKLWLWSIMADYTSGQCLLASLESPMDLPKWDASPYEMKSMYICNYQGLQCAWQCNWTDKKTYDLGLPLLFTLQWSLNFILLEWGITILQRPVSAYLNAHGKTPLEFYFIYFDNKEIYCILMINCLIYFTFSTKRHLFHNFMFFCSNNMFFINQALKFKYPACKNL